MVRGKSYKYLTPEFILSHISEYDIYRFYTGVNFKLNKAFHSPLRNDENPSFVICNKGNRLYHIDYAQSNIRGKCFDFVMQKLGVDYPAAIGIVARDFGLSYTGEKPENRIAPRYEQPKKIKHIDTLIQVKQRNFSSEDLAYWNSYYQDITDLKRENIYAVDKLYINKKRVPLNKTDLIFGYLYEERYWKIYWPHAKNKKDKWRSSVPIDIVDGLENINNCTKSVVTKSKKDKMVLLKIFPCICSVQNESIVALNSNTVSHLKEKGGIVYLNYDADNVGKENSLSATKLFNFKHINVPDYYLKIGIKDYADLAKKMSLQAVIDHFKLKRIL